MKIIISLLLVIMVAVSSYASKDEEEIIGKIRSHEIEGVLSPIIIYEVCLDNVVYFMLVKGYKAGLTAKVKDNNGTMSVYKCKKRGNIWVED